jgi:hypothetical protein
VPFLALPAGMFSEAYIIFSLGLTKPLQKAMFPTCFASHEDCREQLTHVQNYIQICGIIVGECLHLVPKGMAGRSQQQHSVECCQWASS